MRARLLRGASEVGGSLVELEHGGDRIVLDAGMPLRETSFRDLLPDVPGLWSEGDGSLRAIFITHGHADHYGLLDLAVHSVPKYMGRAARAIIGEAAFFSGMEPGFDLAGTLRDGQKIQAGFFEVTPFLVDHSGFDAYALLVEAGGESLLYTGDIRFHGRKEAGMRSIPGRLPSDLDCLIIEGTNLGRVPQSGPRSEEELEGVLAAGFGELEGAALAFYSPQNVDRLVTLYRAARRAGRTLLLDLYGATIAAATGLETVPQADWEGVGVYVRPSERFRVSETREFSRIQGVRADRVFPDEIANSPKEYVVTARRDCVDELQREGCLVGASAYWMQWKGYLERDRELREKLRKGGIGVEHRHVSGHANPSDLAAFARQSGAASVVPIHGDRPGDWAEMNSGTSLTEDGRWWSVRKARETSTKGLELVNTYG